MDVSAIIVNYNGGDLLTRCLTALRSAAGETSLETVVVDNASVDDSLDRVPSNLQPSVVIRSETNLGFGRAVNVGVQQARGKYWLLLNTDCFLDPGSLVTMVDRLEQNPRAAVVGPRLRNADGTLQPTCHNFPNPLIVFFEHSMLWRHFRGGRWADRVTIASSHERPRTVDWVTGACWLVRPAAWRELNGFDPAFFFFWEETDLCRRLQQRNWHVWFDPRAQGTHLGGASSNELALLDHFFNGMYRFYRRHYSWPSLTLTKGIVRSMAFYKALRSALLAIRTRGDARRQAVTAARAWARVLRL